jgi:hypothetical protein
MDPSCSLGVEHAEWNPLTRVQFFLFWKSYDFQELPVRFLEGDDPHAEWNPLKRVQFFLFWKSYDFQELPVLDKWIPLIV